MTRGSSETSRSSSSTGSAPASTRRAERDAPDRARSELVTAPSTYPLQRVVQEHDQQLFASQYRNRVRDAEGQAVGSPIDTVSPPPGVSDSSTSPCCASIQARVSASPSPAPPVSLARDGSARKKRSNARPCRSRGSPG